MRHGARHRFRLCAIALVAAWGLAAPSLARADVGPFGFNTGTTASGISTAQIVGRLKEVHADTIRFAVRWEAVEAARGRYDWSSVDADAEPAIAAGMRLILIPMAAPDWAAASTLCQDIGSQTDCRLPPAPAHVGDYERFVRAMVERYRRHLAAIEIWNEPGSAEFWSPAPDPAAYADVLCAGYAAARAVAPGVPVLVGGLNRRATSSDRRDYGAADFLREMYRALGSRRCADGVGVHPYSAASADPAAPGSAFSEILADVTAIVDAFDPGRALWITEYGATSAGNQPTQRAAEARQATWIVHAMQLAAVNPRVKAFIVHTLLERADLFGSDPEAHYGVLRTDGSLKPAFSALASERATELASLRSAAPPPASTPRKSRKRRKKADRSPRARPGLQARRLPRHTDRVPMSFSRPAP